MDSYEDIEVHDEHPNNYIGNGGANVGFGDGEELVHGYVYHLQEGGATNYDHLVLEEASVVHVDVSMKLTSPPPSLSLSLSSSMMVVLDQVYILPTMSILLPFKIM